MRKLLLLAVAFLLLAAPAYADTTADAEVTVTIEDVFQISCTEDFSIILDTVGEYTADWAEAESTVSVLVDCNFAWRLVAQYDDWDVDAVWDLWLYGDSTTDWVELVAINTDYIILDNQAAGSSDNEINAGIDEIEWDDTGDDTTVTFTVEAETV